MPERDGGTQRTSDNASAELLRSIHTSSLTELLQQTGISLAVSTYQAGHVVLLRNDNGLTNTHFRRFKRPMGMCYDSGRLALGAASEIHQFRNMPDVAERLSDRGPVDACYMPRAAHVTGDIDVHELSWGLPPSGDSDADLRELWFINTRFSCLCTLDRDHSFVPQWRPSFVSGLSPQDRCHLNGLGMIDGRPRFATALGATDTDQGWRANKARGGILIDVERDTVVIDGLSMPHSPRWHDGQLWLLESGDGSIGTVDLGRGVYEPVCRLDGFTRGLDFFGPFAFVGISQVRESVTFSGLPICERLKERTCGVSVVDLRAGREVGWLKFEDAVQEIFAVTVLPHAFPEIVPDSDESVASTWALPDEALKDVSWANES